MKTKTIRSAIEATASGLLVVLLAMESFLTAPAHATMLGNLASDYLDGTPGQTSDDVGISGSGGTWNYWSDTDADPTNGGLTLLTFGSVGVEGGDGFAGTGTILNDCCGPFPEISDDGLFDGFTTPPAGTLASHPGGSGNGIFGTCSRPLWYRHKGSKIKALGFTSAKVCRSSPR